MNSLILTVSWMLSQAAPVPLTLERAVEWAVTRHERAGMAVEQRELAQAQLEKARAFFFPSLDVTGAYTRRPSDIVRNVGGNSLVVQSANALNATATLRWTLLDARGLPLFQSAVKQRDAASHDAKDSVRRLGLDAARAFLMTLASEQVHQAALRRQELAQKSLSEAEARFSARLVSVNDVTRAKLEWASAVREVTRTKGQYQLAGVQLGFLIHDQTPEAYAPPTPFLEEALSASPLEKEALTKAQTQRPDLLSARARAEAARKMSLEPHLRHLPALSLRGTSRLTNEPGIVGRVLDGQLGADLTWTLYDQGLRYAEARETQAKYQLAQLEAEALSRAIDVDVRAALLELQNARSGLLEAQEALSAATLNAGEMAELYRQGLASALEVADASVRLFEADVAWAQERFGVALAFLNLRAAQGLDAFGNPVTP